MEEKLIIEINNDQIKYAVFRADKNYNYSILTKKLSHNAGIKKGKIINFDYTVKTINKVLQDIEQKVKIVFKNIRTSMKYFLLQKNIGTNIRN